MAHALPITPGTVDEIFDMTIVGAGAAGLTAGIYSSPDGSYQRNSKLSRGGNHQWIRPCRDHEKTGERSSE
ncbi:MAG: hypothetical protein KAR19_16930 [Bacteroidales bacterium]|nr:hypothetical protein [Bacteroidales bacterium]